MDFMLMKCETCGATNEVNPSLGFVRNTDGKTYCVEHWAPVLEVKEPTGKPFAAISVSLFLSGVVEVYPSDVEEDGLTMKISQSKDTVTSMVVSAPGIPVMNREEAQEATTLALHALVSQLREKLEANGVSELSTAALRGNLN